MDATIAMARTFLENSWFTLRADKMLINRGLNYTLAEVTPVDLGTTGLSIASFGEDADGELYVVHYGGTIHQITAAP